jgi:hypothetical protein
MGCGLPVSSLLRLNATFVIPFFSIVTLFPCPGFVQSSSAQNLRRLIRHLKHCQILHTWHILLNSDSGIAHHCHNCRVIIAFLRALRGQRRFVPHMTDPIYESYLEDHDYNSNLMITGGANKRVRSNFYHA